MKKTYPTPVSLYIPKTFIFHNIIIVCQPIIITLFQTTLQLDKQELTLKSPQHTTLAIPLERNYTVSFLGKYNFPRFFSHSLGKIFQRVFMLNGPM